MATTYLTVDQIIVINADQGGGVGVRSRDGVESNAARPQSGFGGQDTFPELWSKAAAYAHGIASTQYFTDGNKRTAWYSAVTFLRLNDVEFPNVPLIEAETFVQSIAQNVFTTDDEPDKTVWKAAEWFRIKFENQRVGPCVDPRVEFATIVRGWNSEDGQYTLIDGGVHTIGPVDGFPTPDITMGVFMRIHWTQADLNRRHKVRVSVEPADVDAPRVNRSRAEEYAGPPPPSGHPHHVHGVMPSVMAIEIRPVFVGPGRYWVKVLINDSLAVKLPLRVIDFTVQGSPSYAPF